MRIAIISAPATRDSSPAYIQALAKGMGSTGHDVDIIDAWTGDGYRLPAYEFIVVSTEPLSFFSGKISESISKILSVESGLAGKKSAAFVGKGGLFAARVLANLMKAMEREGMIITWSEVLLNLPHAEAMGKRIGA